MAANLKEGSPLDRFIRTDAKIAFDSIENSEKTLCAGFTTIRDPGDHNGIIELRNAINKGQVIGPRVYAAPRAISITGGHGDVSNGYRPEFEPVMQGYGVCDGPEECRKAVRKQVKMGADMIKVMASGGIMSNVASGMAQQLTDSELKAIVETANNFGLTVAAHAHGKDGMEAALRAGVDTIEHGTYLDEESIKLFKKTGKYLVPTLLAGKTVYEMSLIPGVLQPAQKYKAQTAAPKMKSAFAKAYKAGVKIAFGTDTSVSPFGDNWQEFPIMIDAGMPENEAFISATKNAASALKKYDLIGSINAGKYADIIAYDKDPLKDITITSNADFIMKDGMVFRYQGNGFCQKFVSP